MAKMKGKGGSPKPAAVPAMAQDEGDEDELVQAVVIDRELLRIGKIIGWMLIAAGCITGVALAWPLISMVIITLLPFVAALVLAYVFNPVVTFIQVRLKLSRIGGVLFLYGVALVMLAGFFALVLPNLIAQISAAYKAAAEFIQQQVERSPEIASLHAQLMIWMEANGINLNEMLFQSEDLRRAAGTAASSGLKAVEGAFNLVRDVAMAIFGTIFALVFLVLVNIYLLLDFHRLRPAIEIMTPEQFRPRLFDILGKIDIAVGGFIRGTLISATLVGIIQGVSVWMLGVFYIDGLQEYALLIALLAGVGTLVPYLGPIAGGAPAVLYVLFTDALPDFNTRMISLLLVLALLALVQAIEGFVFQPRIVGQNAQLHPLVVLLALALGANFGILGMIVAVPLASIGRVLVKEFYWDERKAAWLARHPPAPRKKRQAAPA